MVATPEPEYEIFLACCQQVILREIAEPKATQRTVAQTYRMTIEAVHKNGEVVDWKTINEAIVARWGDKGRERIKNMAWSGKCFEPRKERKRA